MNSTASAAATDVIFPSANVNAGECDLKLLVSDAQIAAGVFHLPTQTFTQIITPSVSAKNDGKKTISLFNDFATNHISAINYNSVTVAFLSQAVTLVPSHLYEEVSKDDYMCLVEEPNSNKVILSDHKEDNEFITVFSEDKNLVNAVNAKFPNCKLTHTASFLLNHLQKDYNAGNTQHIFAYVLPGRLQLIVTGKKKPVFYNIFSYSSPEDFIYYILLVYKKLGFDPEKQQLIFLGEILSQSKLFELTIKYIRHVGYGKRPDGAIKFSAELSQLPPHFYYSIFAIL